MLCFPNCGRTLAILVSEIGITDLIVTSLV